MPRACRRRPPKLPEAPQVPLAAEDGVDPPARGSAILLRVELPAPPPPPPLRSKGRSRRRSSPPPPPSSRPISPMLVRDGDPRVRRRAALAIGRVGFEGWRAAARRRADRHRPRRARRWPRSRSGSSAIATAESALTAAAAAIASRSCAAAPPKRSASSARPGLAPARSARWSPSTRRARLSSRCSPTTSGGRSRRRPKRSSSGCSRSCG